MINEQEEVKMFFGCVDNIENDVISIRCYAGFDNIKNIKVDRNDINNNNNIIVKGSHVLVGFRYKNTKLLSCYYVLNNADNEEDKMFFDEYMGMYD